MIGEMRIVWFHLVSNTRVSWRDLWRVPTVVRPILPRALRQVVNSSRVPSRGWLRTHYCYQQWEGNPMYTYIVIRIWPWAVSTIEIIIQLTPVNLKNTSVHHELSILPTPGEQSRTLACLSKTPRRAVAPSDTRSFRCPRTSEVYH